MNLKKKDIILIKFISNEASHIDLDHLEEWIQIPENEELFKTYIRINYAVECTMKKFDSEKTKKHLLDKIEKETKTIKLKKIRKRIIYTMAAATIAMLFSAIYFQRDINLNDHVNKNQKITNQNIEIGTDKATLTLEDGSIVALEKGNDYKTKNLNSNGEELVYQSGNRNSKSIAYNYLTVPRAGQFHIVLSDGTEVWLNSESQLKYPVLFKEGETRQVELVYGEAYFYVSSSKVNGGSKFKVLNKSQEIEVLGTQFNLKAYKNELNVYTTLVEGKVLISASKEKRILEPSQQSKLNIENNTLGIAKVDVYNEISWKDGIFSFQRKSLEEIMKVLSRWYDVDVEFADSKLKKLGFNGVLDKNQNIIEILNIIKSYETIKDYEIIDKTIILK